MGAVLFRQQQARRIHIGAGDVGMDVDPPRHREKTRCVHRLVGFSAYWCDDLIIANPKIADFIAIVGGIDDMRAFDVNQHTAALACPRQAASRPMTWATLGAALRAEAVTATRVPASAECTTAS